MVWKRATLWAPLPTKQDSTHAILKTFASIKRSLHLIYRKACHAKSCSTSKRSGLVKNPCVCKSPTRVPEFGLPNQAQTRQKKGPYESLAKTRARQGKDRVNQTRAAQLAKVPSARNPVPDPARLAAGVHPANLALANLALASEPPERHQANGHPVARPAKHRLANDRRADRGKNLPAENHPVNTLLVFFTGGANHRQRTVRIIGVGVEVLQTQHVAQLVLLAQP